jgi:23S rRNA (guanosine2251-2'-O)-methyltransferase
MAGRGRGTPKRAGAPKRAAPPKRDTPARRSAPARGASSKGPKPTQASKPSRPKGLGGEQVEGRQAVRELLLAGRRRVHEVWVSTDLEGSDVVDDIVALARDLRVPVTHVARKRLEAEARSEAPQGVLAKAAPLREADLDALVRRRPDRHPFLVAVDGVTDPGNLGAILRSCEGAGVDGVVLPRHRAVHVTPTTAKTAAGAVEHVPIAVVSGLPSALARMREAGVWVVGLDDAAERILFDLGELATEGICLVLGAEGAGLSRLVRERCDLIVSIPMRGRLSSLNVSAAAALAVFEVARRRAR